jgi:PAS domain S-box-containing protein
MTDTSSLQTELDAALEREAALRRSHDELRDFLDNAAIGLHWVGPDGTILWANRAEMELLGYPEDEYVGRHIGDFHADADVIDDILARLTRGETLHSYPARLRCRDGSVRHVLISSNVRWEEGQFVHTRCFTRDVTEMKRAADAREAALARERAAREAAEAALRAREEFISAAAHELKTPVTSLRLAAEMLLKRLDHEQAIDLRRVRQVLRTVDEQSVRLSRLVSQLLDVSRLDAGELALVPEPIDLVSLARGAVDEARRSAPGAAFELVGSTAVVVRADAERIGQVVANLLDNAIRYSPEGAVVRLEMETGDGVGTLAVVDRGMGVAPEHRERIFERFYQAHHVEHYSGMGLSLHIGRRMVELQGGSLRAEFPSTGGSRFVLELPLDA